MASKYWIQGPKLRPWSRMFVSPLPNANGWFIASVVYHHTKGEEPENEVPDISVKHFTSQSEQGVLDVAKKWLDDEFGPGVHIKELNG